ncbi:hypothetical protein BJ508DRAFT_3253 [Ascobolus immersus RN42]|uniref:Uncharacterized protein n=1 Tax=Ascobolus immersus RN42 TaxID=1160509 RepID=A0A3N4IPQ0_ASCIM|nr:hypothetical protein BJ508DRAFT_3253 [Ascobolus immersus RN42]
METRQNDSYSTFHHSFMTSDLEPPSFPSSSSESASSVASSANNSTTTHATVDSTIQTSSHTDPRASTLEYTPPSTFLGMDEAMFPTDEDFEEEEDESHDHGPGWEGIYDSHDEEDDDEEDEDYSTDEDEDDEDDEDDSDDEDASGMSVIGSPSHAWANLLPVLLSTISGSQVPDMDNSPNWYENININTFQQILGYPLSYPLTNSGASITPTSSLATSIIAGSNSDGQATPTGSNSGGSTVISGDDTNTTSGSGMNTPSSSTTTAPTGNAPQQTPQQQLQNTLAANTLALANYALHGVVPPGNFPSIQLSFPGPTVAFFESLGLNMLTSGLDGGLLSGDIPEYDIETPHDPEASMSDIDNGDFVGFMQDIYHRRDKYGLMERISSMATSLRDFARHRPEEITDKDIEVNGGDSQGIPWGKEGLLITREEAREVRRKTYHNFRNFVPNPYMPRSYSSTYHVCFFFPNLCGGRVANLAVGS